MRGPENLDGKQPMTSMQGNKTSREATGHHDASDAQTAPSHEIQQGVSSSPAQEAPKRYVAPSDSSGEAFGESVHCRCVCRKAPTKDTKSLKPKQMSAEMTPSPTHDPYDLMPEPISTSPAEESPQVDKPPHKKSEQVNVQPLPAAKKAEVCQQILQNIYMQVIVFDINSFIL